MGEGEGEARGMDSATRRLNGVGGTEWKEWDRKGKERENRTRLEDGTVLRV